ncbi:MAG TPA: TetR family transcriptional regulator [Allosphingosinicella sp.]|nr:TetR family transcriptional regulator [Allosphingosinicella sp.]
MKITQQQVVTAALALVDKEGLDKLNMRALANRLGVQPSALYWHVGSKEELLSRMATDFIGRAVTAAPVSMGWREWLLAFGQAFLAELLAHRDSARLCAIARPVDIGAKEMNDRLVEELVSAGLDPETALSYLSSVIALSLGCAFCEQTRAFHDIPYLPAAAAAHATGLSSMVAGFAEPAAARLRPLPLLQRRGAQRQ